MRTRLSKPAMTALAIAGVALLVNGCDAQVQATPLDVPQATFAAPSVPSAPITTVPQAPAAAFDGLDTRARQATADGARSGAKMTVAVLDRTTGQLIASNANQSFPTASVVKLFIADDLLLQESKGETKLTAADHQLLDIMLRSSDDSAAQQFWDRSGGNAIISRIVARYGLTGTIAPYNGHWDVTQTTANDMVRYYAKLLDGSGGLPAAQAEVIMSDLAQSTPTGTDGYPQRFGIPEGLYAETVAVKQGWFCCWSGPNQLHVSTGVIGADRRYVMVISSLDPTSAASARDDITQAVKTMFPGGHI